MPFRIATNLRFWKGLILKTESKHWFKFLFLHSEKKNTWWKFYFIVVIDPCIAIVFCHSLNILNLSFKSLFFSLTASFLAKLFSKKLFLINSEVWKHQAYQIQSKLVQSSRFVGRYSCDSLYLQFPKMGLKIQTLFVRSNRKFFFFKLWSL